MLAAAAARDGARRPWLPWVLAAWAAVSALSYHPHFIAYFNELIGRRRQRLPLPRRLEPGLGGPLVLHRALPAPPPRAARWWSSPRAPQAGDILVGANQLVGVFHPEKYRWLRENFRPVGHVGYSHLLFRITPEELAALPPPAPP